MYFKYHESCITSIDGIIESAMKRHLPQSAEKAENHHLFGAKLFFVLITGFKELESEALWVTNNLAEVGHDHRHGHV